MPNLNNRRNSAIIAGSVGVLFLGIILYNQIAQSPSGYAAQLARKREQKDLWMRNSPESPLPREARDSFPGLSYFPARDLYRVEAQFAPSESRDTLQLTASTGEAYPIVGAGEFRFRLQGVECRLRAFRYLDKRSDLLFLPFSDLTSGVSTYGGGRYLDLEAREPFVLDFNEAYAPYCAYNENYVCPLPPPENHLPLEIAAGERLAGKR